MFATSLTSLGVTGLIPTSAFLFDILCLAFFRFSFLYSVTILTLLTTATLLTIPTLLTQLRLQRS